MEPQAAEPTTPAESAPAKGRPFPISLMCAVGWVCDFWLVEDSLRKAFSPSHGVGWLPWFGAACGLAGIACFVAIWRMRRVGVLGYVVVTAVENAVLIAIHLWTIPALLFPAMFTFVGLAFLDRMK